MDILTPTDPTQRGAQLSVSFRCCRPTSATTVNAAGEEVVEVVPAVTNIDSILAALGKEGVVCDCRRPDVIRIAPAPLYNSFRDVYDVVAALKVILAL